MSGWRKMTETYGDKWLVLMPPEGRPTLKIENTRLDLTNGTQYVREICRIKADPGEVIVIQKYGCVVIQPGQNDEWVGFEPKLVSPYALQGRASWSLKIDAQEAAGDHVSVLNGVTFNHAVPVPPTPPNVTGISWFSVFGYQQGDAPVAVGPGHTVSLFVSTYGDNGSALTPPPPEFPLTFSGILSGYRLPFFSEAALPQGKRKP